MRVALLPHVQHPGLGVVDEAAGELAAIPAARVLGLEEIDAGVRAGCTVIGDDAVAVVASALGHVGAQRGRADAGALLREEAHVAERGERARELRLEVDDLGRRQERVEVIDARGGARRRVGVARWRLNLE